MYDQPKKKLAINTAMLYILTLSNYLFAFLTIPYQTRILGPDLYGVLGFASATMIYFQMIFDFGFMLSGTADIATYRNDKQKVSTIFESIIAAKFVLLILCFIAILLMCSFIQKLKEYSLVFYIYFIYSFFNSLIPDYLYRGMEIMKPITYRTVFIKLLFTIMIFAFVKCPSDYYLVPCFYLLGSVVAVIIAIIDVYKRFRLPIVSISFFDVRLQLKHSLPFFISRIASTVYGATNTFLLGLKFSGLPIMGYYSSAEKVVAVARAGASPISDSLYPYLIAHKDFRLVKKVLSILMPVIVFLGILLFAIAPQFCEIIFGKGYGAAGNALRCFIPVMILVLPSYIMGFPVMTPLGIADKANKSVIIGAGVQIICLLILWITGTFGILSVCLSTSITELFVFIYRCLAVYRAIAEKKN